MCLTLSGEKDCASNVVLEFLAHSQDWLVPWEELEKDLCSHVTVTSVAI